MSKIRIRRWKDLLCEYGETIIEPFDSFDRSVQFTTYMKRFCKCEFNAAIDEDGLYNVLVLGDRWYFHPNWLERDNTKVDNNAVYPSGKATDFDSVYRGFDSHHRSHAQF